MALLPKNQRDQAMTLVSIIGLALIGLYWVYVYSPKRETLAATEIRVDSLEAKNAAAKKEMATGSVEKVKGEAAKFEKDLDVMRQLVPTGNEVPALLEQVSTAARRVGLDIATVEPEAVVEGDQFDTYRYKLAVSGGYHAVGEFLTNVGSLTRIVAPVNVSLANTANRNQKGAHDALDAKFEVQTYVSKTAPRARGGKS
ncbi:MAG: type 4a pilus biogenesis protein PilO [Gemmatimonadaceae bacterium]